MQYVLLVSGNFFSTTCLLVRFVHVLCRADVHFFPLLYSIAFYEYSTIYLSFLLLTNVCCFQFFFSPAITSNVGINFLLYVFFGAHTYTFLCFTYVRMKLVMSQSAYVFSFQQIMQTTFNAAPVYMPGVDESSSCSLFSPTLVLRNSFLKIQLFL